MISFSKESQMVKKAAPPAAAPATQPQALVQAPAPQPQAPVPSIDLAKQGSVHFKIGEKLPGVFGEYSSLEVEIGLSVPGDPAQFEKVIDKFLPRMVLKAQTTMNAIAEGSGYKAVWAQAQGAPPTTPK
jgi:LAS superfamily LD-carboxypeptidase LdcB